MCGPPTPTQSSLVYHTGIQPSCGAGAMLQSLHSNVLHYNQKHLAWGLEWSQHYSINGQTAPHRGPIIVGWERISAFFYCIVFPLLYDTRPKAKLNCSTDFMNIILQKGELYYADSLESGMGNT